MAPPFIWPSVSATRVALRTRTSVRWAARATSPRATSAIRDASSEAPTRPARPPSFVKRRKADVIRSLSGVTSSPSRCGRQASLAEDGPRAREPGRGLRTRAPPARWPGRSSALERGPRHRSRGVQPRTVRRGETRHHGKDLSHCGSQCMSTTRAIPPPWSGARGRRGTERLEAHPCPLRRCSSPSTRSSAGSGGSGRAAGAQAARAVARTSSASASCSPLAIACGSSIRSGHVSVPTYSALDVAPRGDVERGPLDERPDGVDRRERATGPRERRSRSRDARHDHVDRRPMAIHQVEPGVEPHPPGGELRRRVLRSTTRTGPGRGARGAPSPPS